MEEKKIKELVVISSDELTKVSSVLNPNQLSFLFRATPQEHIYKRAAKGGGEWSYVTGVYVKKVLNMMFGWQWNFEVVSFDVNMSAKQVIVLGKLTCTTEKGDIIKNQFGRADIKYKTSWEGGKKTSTDDPLDLGNDLKAATTDALKKCASELGIASDIYGAEEFKSIKIVESTKDMDNDAKLEKIIELFEELTSLLREDDIMNLHRIIDEKEVSSYDKALKNLFALKK